MVKISVVMPVYNAEQFLKESVNSILNQTFGDLELICVDDGSSDNSLDILNEFKNNDDRVRIFSLDHQGGGNARNYGLTQIKGKYLYCMDADDTIKSDAFETFYQIAEEKELDFLVFKATHHNVEKDEYYETDYHNMTRISELVHDNVFNYKDLGDVLFDFNVSPWCKFYNAEFIKKTKAEFRENSKFHDNQFFWDIIFQAERIYFIDEFFYIRKRHEDSLTASGDIRHINIIGVVNDILKLFIKHNQLNNYKDKLYNLKITWIMDRYNEIQEEYKEKFFRELKNDFEKFENTEFKDLLTDNNKFIFYNVLTSNNHDDFDLMSRLYDRKIKETSRQRNELEECINIINENSIEIDRLNDELDKKNKVKNFLSKLKNRNHRSEKMHKSSYNKMKKFKEDYLNPKKD